MNGAAVRSEVLILANEDVLILANEEEEVLILEGARTPIHYNQLTIFFIHPPPPPLHPLSSLHRQNALSGKGSTRSFNSAIMYCRENKALLHKRYYAEIAKERMHHEDHHLIQKHKALLSTF